MFPFQHPNTTQNFPPPSLNSLLVYQESKLSSSQADTAQNNYVATGQAILRVYVSRLGLGIKELILISCRSLAGTRERLVNFTIKYSKSVPLLSPIMLAFTKPNHPYCSVIPQVLTLAQTLCDSVFIVWLHLV